MRLGSRGLLTAVAIAATLAAPRTGLSSPPRCSIVEISASETFSLARAQDGSLYAWGNPGYTACPGCLKIPINLARPVRAHQLGPYVSLGSGDHHAFGVLADGSLAAWGYGRFGELGIGSNPLALVVEPEAVPGFAAIVKVGGGLISSAALDATGAAWTWGDNLYGQLGDGTNLSSNAPVLVGGLPAAVTDISSGYLHVLTRLSNGSVWGWGLNAFAQLGDGTFNDSNVPVPAFNISTATSVAAGGGFSLALRSDGRVSAWGDNSSGQLGDGSGIGKTRPVSVLNLDNVVAVEAGAEHSLAIRADRTLWVWGSNFFGQLGDGSRAHAWMPQAVQGVTGVVSASCGSWHTLALLDDGSLWAWGNNNSGQLGIGNEDDQYWPQRVDLDYVPGEQGNVLLAAKAGVDVRLEFPDALALLWRIEAAGSKGAAGSALSPDLEARGWPHPGAAVDASTYYYELRGLSLCTSTPGP